MSLFELEGQTVEKEGELFNHLKNKTKNRCEKSQPVVLQDLTLG